MTAETAQAQALSAIALTSDEGEARWWFDGLAVIKARAADTGGQLSIVEVTEGPGAAAPLHVHYREDESFWILEGGATFVIGDATIKASAGDFLFGPRNVPHRYTVGDEGCRMLFICTPGSFEELVIAMSCPAESRTLPPPATEMPDFAWVASVARAHGCALLM